MCFLIFILSHVNLFYVNLFIFFLFFTCVLLSMVYFNLNLFNFFLINSIYCSNYFVFILYCHAWVYYLFLYDHSLKYFFHMFFVLLIYKSLVSMFEDYIGISYFFICKLFGLYSVKTCSILICIFYIFYISVNLSIF
jgi:hypothetical protein